MTDAGKWECKPDELFPGQTKCTMDVAGFRLSVNVNMGHTTRFSDVTRDNPTYRWYIERTEWLPAGEELTLEEAKAEIVKHFREMTP